MAKIELDAFDVVNTTLLLHTVVAAGLGKDSFLKKLSKQVRLLTDEYQKQVPKDQQAEVAEKIMKYWGVKT